MTDEAVTARTATQWLAGPAPTGRLPREDLEERILNLLASQNMCVLATAGSDGALATPVRYFNLRFDLVFTAEAGSPKLRNIDIDPRVSIGVFVPLVSQASSRGAQLFGTASIVWPGDELFERFMAVYRWESDAAERGRPLDRPPGGPAVVVTVERITYTEHWLRRQGCSPRQFWARA